MNYQFNIRSGFSQKALGIILAVIMSIGFSFGGALAGGCEGGSGCPVCAEIPHGHVPAAADMQNPGCTPEGPNSSCGFESGQDPDNFHSIVSSTRSDQQSHAGIFAAVSDEFGQALFPKKRIPQILLSDSTTPTPIYLLNQSLLC